MASPSPRSARSGESLSLQDLQITLLSNYGFIGDLVLVGTTIRRLMRWGVHVYGETKLAHKPSGEKFTLSRDFQEVVSFFYRTVCLLPVTK